MKQHSDNDWKPVERKNGHDWGYWKADKYQICSICGYVRRADDQNKPCRGPVKLSLRGGSTTLWTRL